MPRSRQERTTPPWAARWSPGRGAGRASSGVVRSGLGGFGGADGALGRRDGRLGCRLPEIRLASLELGDAVLQAVQDAVDLVHAVAAQCGVEAHRGDLARGE